MRFVLFFLLAVAGTVVGQVFLSRTENRLPGLILPGISFIISCLYALSVANFGDETIAVRTTTAVFVLCNIPTAILLVIYFACRERFRRKRDIDKMSAQDLK
ncbi:MAG: hypothetical protein LBS90_05775 [Oscillospiraceae bacterium]|jgi:Na+/melibiose symporter-like transporter|nr:hypothetical protein [Oscillospiraceae bacterium]